MVVDVATFGEILWDIFETGEGVYRRELGGAPANLAVVLARLGVKSRVVGGVGADSFGRALVALLKREKVDVSKVVVLPQRTGLTFVSRDKAGEPSFLFYRHETADMSVDDGNLPDAAGKATFAVVGTSTLMTDGLWDATTAFAAQARKAKGAFVVDLNVRAHLWPSATRMRTEIADLVRHAHIVKASASDLAALAPEDGMGFLARHAPKAVWVVTRGGDRATISGAMEPFDVRTKKVPVLDATGAGDAFLGGVLATLVRSKATPGTAQWKRRAVWERAAENGHAVAAQAVRGLGGTSAIKNLAAITRRLQVKA